MIAVIQAERSRERVRKDINRSFLNVHGPLEVAQARDARKALKIVHDRIISRLRRNGSLPGSVEEIFFAEEHRADFNRLLVPRWNDCLWMGAGFEARWIEANQPTEQMMSPIVQQRFNDDPEPPPGLDIEFPDELSRSIKTRLTERQVGVWSEVSATINKKLQREIATALVQGRRLDDFADDLHKILKNRERWQAERIARTETTFLMNDGEQLERDALGIASKEWISTIDQRTRVQKFDHISPMGQVRKNNRWFSVSGERLNYPGDKSLGASAGNVINCRCASVSYFE